MPSSAALFLAPISIPTYYDNRAGLSFWGDVFGVKMTCLQPRAKVQFDLICFIRLLTRAPLQADFFEKPVYSRILKPEDVIGTTQVRTLCSTTRVDKRPLIVADIVGRHVYGDFR